MMAAPSAPTPGPVELTWPRAMAVLAALAPAARAAGGCIDLSALVRFDSSALAVLLELRRQCGPALRIVHVPPALRALAGLYGVEALLFDASTASEVQS